MNHPRRTSFIALVVSSVLATGLAGAAQSHSGHVAVPAGSPTAPRLVYLATSVNEVLGAVVNLGGPIPDGRPFVLKKMGGLGPVDLDVYFYSDLYGANGEGYACRAIDAHDDGSGGETGTVICGDSNRDGSTDARDRARWAVVVTKVGLLVDFTLSW